MRRLSADDSSSLFFVVVHNAVKRATNGGLDPSCLDLALLGRPDFQSSGPQIPIFRRLRDLWTENRGAPKTPNPTTTDPTPHSRPSETKGREPLKVRDSRVIPRGCMGCVDGSHSKRWAPSHWRSCWGMLDVPWPNLRRLLHIEVFAHVRSLQKLVGNIFLAFAGDARGEIFGAFTRRAQQLWKQKSEHF